MLVVAQCLETIVSHIVYRLPFIYSRRVSLVPVILLSLGVEFPIAFSNIRPMA